MSRIFRPVAAAAALVLGAPAGGAFLVGGALVVAATPALAQVGSTTDIITGRITGTTGQPIAGAQVTATSLETGVNRSRTTNDKGVYTILFPDGGGRYRLTVRAIGQRPQTVNVQREGDEDRLVANVKLGEAPTQLSAVRVTERRQPAGPPGGGRPEPGNSERQVSTEQALRLPVDATDPNSIAALAPGVVSQRGNDSTAASFNVAGQRASQNNVTLDGLTFGGASFPQEAVRGTRVITNTYDVARGQFSGGQVASTTRSGTNVLFASGSYSNRNPSLQWRPDFGGVYGQGYTQNQLSLGVGGPIVKDRAFYFGAATLSRRTDPLTSLLGADPNALRQLGVSSDSVGTFLNQLRQLGIAGTTPAIPSSRLNDQIFGIVRLDYNLTDEHTLTLRGDYRRNSQDASRISPFAVPTNGGDQSGHGAGVLASLTSRFGASFVNEAKVYATVDQREATPYVTIPGGRVRLTSQLEDGTTSLASLGFGANASLPSDANNDYVEGTNELSWLSSGGGHRVKLGGLLNASRYDQQTAFNPYGTYTYNSLADFLAGRPATFTRSLATRSNEGGALSAAGYLGDTWRQSRNFQLTYGARVEGSTYDGAPRRNTAVEQTFGLRTDRFPSEVHVSPRVGFTWTYFPPEDTATTGRRAEREGQRAQRAAAQQSAFRGGPTLFVRGGVGEFRGRAPSTLFSAAQQGSGVAGDETQLTCIGAAVPLPDYPAFLTRGIDAIPTQCAAVNGGPIPGSATQFSAAPTVTAFTPDFQAPRSWRASLGVTKRFWERWTAGLDAQYAWGVSQYGVRDLNLNTAPQFTLPDEGNRPVYVPAAAIIPTTGATALAASRVDPRFGQVLEISSGLASRNAQVTATLGGFTAKGVNFNFSYTYSRSRDQSSYAFGAPSFGFQQTPTAGNPNVLGWASSDQDVRHNVIGTLTYPLNPSFEVTTITRLTSGAPYTPTVQNDVNGDGARNDRAFIFSPTAAGIDPTLAAGMQKVLASAPASARDCLTSQLNQVAARNSCRGPWTPSVDVQLNYKPDRFGLKRRMTISALLMNPLAGLDQALHGSDRLRGWGQQVRPDQTLLAVRGFDAASKRYVYQVNERFGSTVGSARAFRQTFQIGLQARFVYGQNAFGGFFGGGGGGGGGDRRGGFGGGGAGGGPAAAFDFSSGARANPIAQIIDLRDSLALDSAQVTKLEPVRDSLAERGKRFGEEIRAAIAKLGNNPDQALVFSTIRPRLNEGRTLIENAMKDAQAILTPEQWAKVPENVKNPFRPGGQQGGDQRRRPNP